MVALNLDSFFSSLSDRTKLMRLLIFLFCFLLPVSVALAEQCYEPNTGYTPRWCELTKIKQGTEPLVKLEVSGKSYYILRKESDYYLSDKQPPTTNIHKFKADATVVNDYLCFKQKSGVVAICYR